MAGAPTIAISMGDPGGIGPEVVVKALADASLRQRARFVIFGADGALCGAAAAARIAPFWTPADGGARADGVSLVDLGAPAPPTAGATAASGEASLRYVEGAIQLALRDPRATGVVTAPISKEAWALAGHGRWPGHTELFAERCGGARHAMMFVSPRLRVALASAHVPLKNVPAALSTNRIVEVIELAAAACERIDGRKARVAVAGLNPHAGEGGLLGEEEQRIIAPAVERARAMGIDARGPLPGDTVFIAAARGDYELVVAMYHDQGLIPVKLLGWESAVNMTAGLPIVRTSPDHGTAFDIAGQNKADARSMRAAIDLAIRLLER